MFRLISAYLTTKEFNFKMYVKVNDDVVFDIRNIIYEKANNCIYKFGNTVEIIEANQKEFLEELHRLVTNDRYNHTIEMLNNVDLDFYLPVVRIAPLGIVSLYELLTSDNDVKTNWYFNVNTLGGSEVVNANQLAEFLVDKDGNIRIRNMFILEIDYLKNIKNKKQ